MAIELSILTTYQEFKGFSRTWEAFRQQQADNTACNSWDWCNTWIDVFWRDKDQLYIHIWYDKEEVIGIIPCYLKSTLAGDELRFIATGEPTKSEICSEFQDFLLNSEFEKRILMQFTNKILAERHISAIVFSNILITSKAYQWLESLNKYDWIKTIKNSSKRYIIPIKKDVTTQISSFKSNNIKRHAKKFIANTQCHIVTINDNVALNDFYPQLIKEHNSAWRKRGEMGAFEQPDFVAFHRLFMNRMLKKHKLVAFKLESENEVSALFYGIIDGNTLYYYQSAINHESNLSSAGVAMHVVALDIAREKNLMFYDLMQGATNSYKARYITNDIIVVNIALFTKKHHYLMCLKQLTKKVKIKLNRTLKISVQ
jgi:CelD/BcsL family acetyltransferase involved in cellulose biosynthesis